MATDKIDFLPFCSRNPKIINHVNGIGFPSHHMQLPLIPGFPIDVMGTAIRSEPLVFSGAGIIGFMTNVPIWISLFQF